MRSRVHGWMQSCEWACSGLIARSWKTAVMGEIKAQFGRTGQVHSAETVVMKSTNSRLAQRRRKIALRPPVETPSTGTGSVRKGCQITSAPTSGMGSAPRLRAITP